MGRKKLEKFDFDPADLTKTLHVGDIILVQVRNGKQSPDRVLVLTGKEYGFDFAITYVFASTGKKSVVRISERSLLRQGAGGYARIHKVPRKIITTEKRYSGVFLGRQEA